MNLPPRGSSFPEPHPVHIFVLAWLTTKHALNDGIHEMVDAAEHLKKGELAAATSNSRRAVKALDRLLPGGDRSEFDAPAKVVMDRLLDDDSPLRSDFEYWQSHGNKDVQETAVRGLEALNHQNINAAIAEAANAVIAIEADDVIHWVLEHQRIHGPQSLAGDLGTNDGGGGGHGR